MNFYETVGGKRFIEGTIPQLSKNISELTKTIKEAITKKPSYTIATIDGTNLEPYLKERLSLGEKFVSNTVAWSRTDNRDETTYMYVVITQK